MNYQLIIKIIIFFNFLLLSIIGYSQCTNVPVEEAIINGDFESGYIASGSGSFTTVQDYAGPAVAAILAGSNPGCHWGTYPKYYIGPGKQTYRCESTDYTNRSVFSPDVAVRDDHTASMGGNGNFMMVDTRDGGGSIWETTVNVYSFQTYYFSSWITNLNTVSVGNPASLVFQVKGNLDAGWTTLGPAFTPTGAPGNWTRYYATWISTGNTAASIRLFNTNTTPFTTVGNDFAIDDISFTNGCQSAVSVPYNPDLGPDQNYCLTNGTITLNPGVATNGSRAFSWYSGTSSSQTLLVNQSTTQNTYNITAPGTYRVCVYEAGNCPASSTIVITNTLSVNIADATICNTSTPTTLDAVTSGPNLSYAWTKDGSSIGTNSRTISANAGGNYRVTVTPTSPINSHCTAVFDNALVTNVEPTITTSSSPCTGTVTAPGAGPFYWFTGLNSYPKAHQGAVYNPPIPSKSSTFYVENAFGTSTYNAGKNQPSVGYENGSLLQNTTFTTYKPLRLLSVANTCKYAQSGNITITNLGTSAVVAIVPFSHSTGGSQAAPLNIDMDVNLSAGTYRISSSSSCPGAMFDNTTQTGVSGVVSTFNNDHLVKFVFKDTYNCPRKSVTLPCALPVDLLYFNASAHTNSVLLNWATTSEKNNKYFVIERSQDGITFESVGTVTGNGNSSTLSEYDFTDTTPLQGTSYYRLRQVDFDGQFEYSDIQSVSFTNANLISVYPNPNTGTFCIQSLTNHEELSYEVTNAIGQEITSGLVTSEKEEINLSEFNKGVFFVKVYSNSTTSVFRVVVE